MDATGVGIVCLIVISSLRCVYLAQVHSCDVLMNDASVYNTITFQDSGEHLMNPGRGFYHRSLTFSNNQDFLPLQSSQLDCWRKRDGTNLLLRQYVLEDSINKTSLSSLFLARVEADLNTLRQAGWSVILRFLYNKDTDLKYDKTHEPSLAGILQHITQLGPILLHHQAIVIALQVGFLGEYGVWYEPGNTISSEPPLNYQREILQQLITVVPNTIQIQIPKPTYKQHLFHKETTSTDAYQHSNVSRIGHYHECLLGGDNTNHFKDAYSNLESDVAALDYLSKDTNFTLMGGKTCHPGNIVAGSRVTVHIVPPRTNTVTLSFASGDSVVLGGTICTVTLKRIDLCDESRMLFEKIHLSYLDGLDDDIVIKEYKHRGCYNTIYDKLGYRFVLNFAKLPKRAEVNSTVCTQVSISNTGYAAFFRDFKIYIVFMLNQTVVYKANIISRTRVSPPGPQPLLGDTHTLHLGNIPTGVYKVYLGITDGLIENETDYFVLIASSHNGIPVADPHLGLNYLGNVSMVPPGSLGTTANTINGQTKTLQSMSLPVPGRHSRIWIPGKTTSCIQLPGKPPSQTLVDFKAYATCNKLEIVKALLNDDHFESPSSSRCGNGNQYSSEAILNLYCNVTESNLWRRLHGKVIDNCQKLAKYTPIAEFNANAQFEPDRGLAGVFLGCGVSNSGANGIKIGYQTCDKKFDVRFITAVHHVLNDFYVVH